MKTPKMKLTATNLKNQLWETLQDVRSSKIDAKTANAVSGNARGIISTISVEITIQKSKTRLSKSLKGFTA